MKNKIKHNQLHLFQKSIFLAVCLFCLISAAGCSVRLASSVKTAAPTAVFTEAPATAVPTTPAMYAPTPSPTPEPRFFVSVKITGPDGDLLSIPVFETDSETTVFAVLQSVCEKEDLKLDYTGSVKRGTVYVKGIAGIYEKMYGGSSGWTYYVNGQMPSTSVSSYKVNNRDVIEWRYVK